MFTQALLDHGIAPADLLVLDAATGQEAVNVATHFDKALGVTGAILTKAPMGVGSHPAYRVGVAAGGQADGWTVFLIPADTVLTDVVWSVRPDLADRTLSWRV